MVAAAVRTIFAQPDAQPVQAQYDDVQTMLARSHPKVAAMLDHAQEDPLAFAAFPTAHWKKIWSTNPSNASTGRSSAAPTSSVSSPTPKPCCAWPAPSWSRPTTSGPRPTGATCPKPP